MPVFPVLPYPLPAPAGAADDDRFHDECGVFGILGEADAAAKTAFGLHALQHRGQEAAGICSFDGEHFHSHRGIGHVSRVFKSDKVINRLPGTSAIGHNRYSTSGDTVLRNVQPFYADLAFGGIAIGHNGNLTNALTLRRQLVSEGSIFHSTSDTEVIVHLVARSSAASVEDRLIEAMRQVEGAYSLVALSAQGLIGMRDPFGIRPLVLGRQGGAMILASETCALDIIGAEYVRDIEPGEMIVIDPEGNTRSLTPFPAQQRQFCIFEYIYFARPDSICEDLSVYGTRKAIGRELARESHRPVDVVVPVPDSGVPAALGYAEESGVPFEFGIIRNHYVGRTFIQPTQKTRDLGVKRKHNANPAIVKDKRVLLVDDSIVRGTTSIKIVDMVRQAGAREVHMRISSPPTAWPCYYGIDTPKRERLLAARFNHDVEAMAQRLGVDSLHFISLDGLYRAVGEPGRDPGGHRFCDACFTGDYHQPLTDRDSGPAPEQLSLLTEKRK